MSLSANGSGENEEYTQHAEGFLGQDGNKGSVQHEEEEEERDQKAVLRGSGAMNMTKHLWAGAVAAMVSRFPSNLPFFINFQHSNSMI